MILEKILFLVVFGKFFNNLLITLEKIDTNTDRYFEVINQTDSNFISVCLLLFLLSFNISARKYVLSNSNRSAKFFFNLAVFCLFLPLLLHLFLFVQTDVLNYCFGNYYQTD